MKRLLTVLALLLPLAMTAQEEYVDPVFGDNVDRTAGDFVTVSLLTFTMEKRQLHFGVGKVNPGYIRVLKKVSEDSDSGADTESGAPWVYNRCSESSWSV